MYALKWLRETTAEEQVEFWRKIREPRQDVDQEIIQRFAQMGMRHALLLHYERRD